MLDRQSIIPRGVRGWIADGVEFPEGSVQDCKNMDFYEDRLEKRLPYNTLTDYASTTNYTSLGSGYKILGIKEFRINDSGTIKDIRIIGAVDSSNQNAKLIINQWYNPSSAYGNHASGLTASSWLNLYIDLFETVSLTVASLALSGTANSIATFTTGFNSTGKPANYYNGWFVFNASAKCIGIVTQASSASDMQIIMRRNVEVYDNSGNEDLRFISFADTDGLTLCRFPVMGYQSNPIATLTINDIEFIEDRNGVKVVCSTLLGTVPVLNLQFLSATSFFGSGSINWGSSTNEYKRNWYGFWLSEDSPDIKNKKVYRWHQNPAASPNKYYADTDFAKLGIMLYYTFSLTSSPQTESRCGGVMCELDGFQAVFLKNILLEGYGGPNQARFNYVAVVFKVDFDRRLTAVNFFYGEQKDFKVNSEHDNEIDFYVRQLGPQYGGYINISTQHSGQFSTLQNLYTTFLIDTFNIPSANQWNILSLADGATEKSYLNHFYWKDIDVKCNSMFRLGEHYIAVKLNDVSVSTDSNFDKNGSLKICVSQLQDGDENTHSIFPDERVRQLSNTDTLIKGGSTTGDNFLIWTDKDLKSYNIADYHLLRLQNDINFSNRGAYNKKSIIKAQVGYNYGGYYWISPNGSIYRFIDKFPEDILFGRWRDYFQANISEADKQNAVGGFLPRTKEVFFLIGSVIYVWNIDYEHWKIYTYGDTPSLFTESLNQEIVFVSGRATYRSEQPGTTVWKDKTSSTIEWFTQWVSSYGDKTRLKILDRMDIVFEKTVNDSETPSNISLTAGINSKVSTDILNKTVDIGAIEKYTTTLRTRKPYNFLNFKISSTSSNIKTFKLHLLKVVSALTGRQLTRI